MLTHLMIDAIGTAGVVMLAYGLYLLAPVCMFVGIGVMFVAFSLLSSYGTVTVRSPYKQGK